MKWLFDLLFCDGLPSYSTVFVNTKTNKSFRCVITNAWGDYVTLKNCELIDKAGSIKIDNQVLIPKNEIEFIQVIAE